MPSLVVGGVTIKVAPGAITRDRIDNVDRGRAFDNSYKASQSGTPKRDFHFTTPPVLRATADLYETALGYVAPQLCSGDIIGGSTNVVLQSENFGLTWVAVNTPVVTAFAGDSGGVGMSVIVDDSAALREGYEQALTFTGDGVKAISAFVNQGSSTSSVFRIRDNTAVTNRLLAALTWSGGLPVVTMTTGTDLGYEQTATGIFRLKMATTSVTAANANEIGIYVATDAALAVAPTGGLAIGGVQAENAATVGSYTKTTTAAIQALPILCCAHITSPWTPIKAQGGLYASISFTLSEV